MTVRLALGNDVIDKVQSMVVYSCKKCGEPNFLTPHAFWNITNFGTRCEKCETINTITYTQLQHNTLLIKYFYEHTLNGRIYV
jgi:hypothetical protein